MKDCKDCKFVKGKGSFARCVLDERYYPGFLDIISGTYKKGFVDAGYAVFNRSTVGECGPEGDLWQPRKKYW